MTALRPERESGADWYPAGAYDAPWEPRTAPYDPHGSGTPYPPPDGSGEPPVADDAETMALRIPSPSAPPDSAGTAAHGSHGRREAPPATGGRAARRRAAKRRRGRRAAGSGPRVPQRTAPGIRPPR